MLSHRTVLGWPTHAFQLPQLWGTLASIQAVRLGSKCKRLDRPPTDLNDPNNSAHSTQPPLQDPNDLRDLIDPNDLSDLNDLGDRCDLNDLNDSVHSTQPALQDPNDLSES